MPVSLLLLLVQLLCCSSPSPVVALHPAAGYSTYLRRSPTLTPTTPSRNHHNLPPSFITQPPATSHEIFSPHKVRHSDTVFIFGSSSRAANHVWWVSFFFYRVSRVVAKNLVILVHPARSSLRLESIPKGTRWPFPCMPPLKTCLLKQVTLLFRSYLSFLPVAFPRLLSPPATFHLELSSTSSPASPKPLPASSSASIFCLMQSFLSPHS